MPALWTDNVSDRLLHRIAILLGLVVAAAIVTFCYVASSVCISVVASGFVAILIDPLVVRLERLHLSRSLASALVIVCGLGLVIFLAHSIYRKAITFSEELPVYAYRIRETLDPILYKVERVKNNAAAIAPGDHSKRVPEVRVKETPQWPSYLFHGFGSISSTLIVIGVIPFLTFFLLLKRDHMYSRFASMFENRTDVPKFIQELNHMIRGFVVGNIIVGSIVAGITALTFFLMGMKNPLVLGIIAGALNLIPFLGATLAVGVASAAALIQFDTLGPFLVIAGVIIFLHLVATNMLVPRLIGSRVSLGPVAVTIGMLFWGWLWGFFGVILAVPLTAFVKLVADTQPSLVHLSNFLAETPRPAPAPARNLPYASSLRARLKLRSR